MADVNNGDQLSLSLPSKAKRCPSLDLPSQDQEPPKKPKVLDPNNNNNNNNCNPALEPQNDVVPENTQNPPTHQQVQDEQQEQEGDDDDDDDDEDEETVVDRKGKGILIEEDEDEDDSDLGSDSDSDSGVNPNLSDEDSDFADDPLTEVDLDNILPCRTRRRAVQPGAYIANDLPPEDSDDSDDPDA